MNNKKEIKKNTGLILGIVLILFSGFIIFRNLDRNTPQYYDEALYSAKDIDFMKDGQNLLQPQGALQNYYNIKPPLKTWMKYPVYKAFGINTFTIRVLDAVMGIAAVLFVFLIGNRLFGPMAGFTAGFIFVTFKGLLTDYWARVNGYDSGAILGTAAFFYFFIFFRERKAGWLLCGLSLAFITYFKHVSALLPLSIAVLYLLVDKGFRGVFNLRFILMILVWIVPVLAFYIPYAIHNESFIPHFFGYEVFTVVTEGTGQHGRGDTLYYLKWLLKDLADWFPIVTASLIASIILFIKKRQKPLLLILLWFILPLTALTIAATRINRYMFPSFPALALLTGFILAAAFKAFASMKGRHLKGMLPSIAHILLFTFVSIIFVSAAVKAVKYTEPVYRENYHRLYDYYKSKKEGTLYLTEGNNRRYGWAEQVIIHAMGNRCKIMQEENREEKIVQNLKDNDAVALYNYKIFDLFYSDKNTSLSPENYAVVDFALQDFFYAKHKLFRKMIIFRKNSDISAIYKKENIHPLALRSHKGLDSLSDNEFIEYLCRLACGEKKLSDKAVAFYAAKISSGEYSRLEIASRFGCFSRWFTSSAIIDLIENEAAGKDISTFHYFADYYSPSRKGGITLIGLKMANIIPAAKCQVLRTRDKWMILDRKTDIGSVIPKIGENDTLLVRRSDMIRWLEKDEREHIRSNKFSGYSFFSFKKRAGFLRPQARYFNIAGIIKTGGDFYNYLKAKEIELLPLRRPEELIDMDQPSDAEFIKNAVHIIFDCNSEPKYEKSYIEKLKNKTTSRSLLLEMFIEQARKIEY